MPEARVCGRNATQGQARYNRELLSSSSSLSAIMTPIVQAEGKLLSDALNTVKIQVQQMKRNLVRSHSIQKHFPAVARTCSTGTGSVDGCAQKC